MMTVCPFAYVGEEYFVDNDNYQDKGGSERGIDINHPDRCKSCVFYGSIGNFNVCGKRILRPTVINFDGYCDRFVHHLRDPKGSMSAFRQFVLKMQGFDSYYKKVR